MAADAPLRAKGGDNPVSPFFMLGMFAHGILALHTSKVMLEAVDHLTGWRLLS